MSRTGKRPIPLPQGVQVEVSGRTVKVNGPKGKLEQQINEAVDIKVEDSQVRVVPKSEELTGDVKAAYGLARSLLNNMVNGVSQGFTNRLKLVGVGYRGQAKGKGLSLTLGYSHPVEYEPPEGIELSMEGQTTVVVSGANKELVGQVAAKIRGFRPPEPYHGKGVRYENERIVTKVGKAAGKK